MKIKLINRNEVSQSEKYMQQLVINVLLIILVCIAIFVLFGLAEGPTRSALIVLSAVIAVAVIVAILGYPLLGRLVTPVGILVAMLYASFVGDGLHNEILIGTTIVIVLAGLLLGNRGAIIISVVFAIGLIVVGVAEILRAEALNVTTLTTYKDIAIVAISMIVIALVQSFLISNLNKSVEQARRNEEAQIKANIELKSLQADLEQRIDERTKQLNHRALQLQASAEVGRAVSSTSDLNELFDRVTILISERFNFYHVGVFLLDRTGENAVLRASNSPGGKQMLERGHSLPVGSNSIVGFVTQHREPRVALDVGQDAIYFDNPNLPDTRSEMALPLTAAGTLLGALDVQSVEEDAFTQDDIKVLQLLADQVAIAIDNSNLLAESRAALEVSKRAYGEMSRIAWAKLLSSRSNFGYRSDGSGNIQVVDDEWSADLMQIQQNGQISKLDEKTLAIPFKILDLPAGVIKLKKQAGSREWTEREIVFLETLVGNLGEALESARLYEQSQRKAERERVLSEITSRVRASTDVNVILQTAVQDLAEALRVPRGAIRLIQPDAYSQDDEVDLIPPSRPSGNGGSSNE